MGLHKALMSYGTGQEVDLTVGRAGDCGKTVVKVSQHFISQDICFVSQYKY